MDKVETGFMDANADAVEEDSPDIFDDSSDIFDDSDSEMDGKRITNAQFISRLFSVTLRLFIYTALFIFIFIIVQGKSIDPVGYQRIIKALTFTAQTSRVQLENFIPIEEYFDGSIYYNSPEIEPAASQLHSPEQSFTKDIQNQRQELLKLSLQCHQLEGKLVGEDSESQCNKDHLSFHEIVLDQELEINSRPLHQILLNLLKRINEDIYEEEGYKLEHSIGLDADELTTFTDNTLELIDSLQAIVLEKVQNDHETILNSKNSENKNSDFIFDNKMIEESVNNRVLKVLKEYEYEFE